MQMFCVCVWAGCLSVTPIAGAFLRHGGGRRNNLLHIFYKLVHICQLNRNSMWI